MQKRTLIALLSLSLLALLAPLALAQVPAPVATPEAAPAANLTDGCVTDYDPTVDYFPSKATLDYAERLTIEYFNHYKVVTVNDAFDDAPVFSYVLVQCGTPAPPANDFPAGTQFITVPAESIITMSTTQLPHLTQLDLLDRLVGLDSGTFVSSPEVRERVAAGELVEVGFGSGVNVELVLDTEPSLVMTYGFNPDFDAHPVLIEAGVFTALNAEWRETTPLARAEWIKYTALFFNAEARAEEAFALIADAYEDTRQLVAGIPQDERRPVLWNAFSPFTDAWTIPGAETYVGALIRDAGGDLILASAAPVGSELLSFEVVYEAGLDAPVWVVNAFGIFTLDDLLAQDSRYADFLAFRTGNVWNTNLDVTESGGDNYYELGVTNPHLILRDMVAIFYPQLLPDHTFRFHRRLE